MMFLFPNILSNFCVPTLFKEYYEKHSGEAVGRGQTAPMRHPKVSQSFSLGGLTAVNVDKHSNSFFCKFFKRETGMTPQAYQKSK